MKKIILIAFVLLSVTSLQAQVDRTKAPSASAAREIKIGDYQSFTLKNGLQIFLVENHKLPRVQFSLQFKHEAVFEGKKIGYISIAGDLIGTGTKTRTKAQLDEEIDFLGATLSTGASGIFASSLTKHTNKLLDVMTDVLYNPSFEPGELEKLKTQSISGITASKDDPNTISANVRGVLLYGKQHPYGEIATEESVSSITVEDCKQYYDYYFKPNNAYLVIVGDTDLKTAKALAEKYFSKWKPGEVKTEIYNQPKAPTKTFVALVDRPNSVQSIVTVAYPIDLKIGTPDVIKARVMNQILGGDFSSRLNQNLREKRGYTYGSNSSLSSDNLIGNFRSSASVRNEVTDSSVVEMLSELKKIVSEPVSDKELAGAKAAIAGAFGRSLESPQTIASFAVNTAKYNLPKDYYSTFLKRLDGVTSADVQEAAKKYILPDNAYILVVGKGEDVADKLKKFGDVKYYDIKGDIYVPSKAATIPEGLTSTKVIADYITAVGGSKKLQEVKSFKAVYKASAMGTEITMTVVKKTAGKSSTEIGANGMTVQRIVSNGKDVVVSSMGQKAPVDAGMKEKALFESAVFPELDLSKIKATLKAIENVDGKEAFVIEYMLPAGGKSLVYFDRQSGLKVQETESVETPQGTIVATTKYLDYKAVNGVMFPHTVTQSQGPMNFKFEAVTLEVNPAVDETVFKLD